MRFIACAILLCLSGTTAATDLVRTGNSAASAGSANVLGLALDPLTAISGNPAFLTETGERNQASFSSLYVDAGFSSSIGEHASADHGPGVLPEFALARRLRDSQWYWGAGIVVQSAMQADFEFVDPNGTLGVSYGEQTHRSAYVVAKLGGSIAYKVSEALSIGAGLGIAYNRNELESPYIFQSHPVLRSLKVLVDLEADDVAWTATLGLNYAINPDWHVNLAYNLETAFSADGKLSGNLGQLGLGIQEDFSYDANVRTALPASAIAGITWQANARLQLGLQIDWINYQDSFATLPIRLTRGTNPDLNAFLGEDFIYDTAPLDWHDQHVIHIAGKLLLSSGRELRAGIEHSNVIVPRATVTPMTAAILDTAFSVGMNFDIAGTNLDLAYRLSTASDLNVRASALQAGEYSGTRLSLRLHTLGISFSF